MLSGAFQENQVVDLDGDHSDRVPSRYQMESYMYEDDSDLETEADVPQVEPSAAGYREEVSEYAESDGAVAWEDRCILFFHILTF